MSNKPIGDLRRRMIADMTIRTFSEKTQRDYIRHVESFARFLRLVPQIENSLRWVLHNLGTIPSSIDDDGIEEDWPLQRCLNHQKVNECLGADLVFELRSLLIEKGGPNLRNLLAHGLLDAPTCYLVEGFYVWWLMIRMVLAASPSIRQALGAGGRPYDDEAAGLAGAAP
jgi:Domain of unknown function (DUF4209)